MVAPVRTPHSRGVKCELCLSILKQTSWLDPTKPANKIEDAVNVLKLFKKHDSGECPCIPPDIRLLLLGSTHFEIHRLALKSLEDSVHKRQIIFVNNLPRRTKTHINDVDMNDTNLSRFISYIPETKSESQQKLANLTLRHLCSSIDYWNSSFNDENKPFNAKLAMRLCLTHHVIYACYYFRYHHLKVYELKSAILLVNLFKTIEGVTNNAIIHSYYVLIRALIDCNQTALAKQLLKTATKDPIYADSTYYETILLKCVWALLNIKDNYDTYEILKQLEEASKIEAEDKLQHYYARAQALSILIKYAHLLSKPADNCNEFFKTLKLIIGMMRRCYEESLNLVISIKNKEANTLASDTDSSASSLKGHQWIKYAISEFACSTYEDLFQFFKRCGLPECLEIFHNSLVLITFRSYNFYWISKMATIGASLDCLCDNLISGQSKLTVNPVMIGISESIKDVQLVHDLNRISTELIKLEISCRTQKNPFEKESFSNIENQLRDYNSNLCRRLCSLEYFDNLEKNRERLDIYDNTSLNFEHTEYLWTKLVKLKILAYMKNGDQDKVRNELIRISTYQRLSHRNMEFNHVHEFLEILMLTVDIDKTSDRLMKVLEKSAMILKPEDSNSIDSLTDRMSNLNLVKRRNQSRQTKTKTNETIPTKASILCKPRRQSYLVSSEEFLTTSSTCNQKIVSMTDCLANANDLSNNDIISAYLRHSSPNPDFNYYCKANEYMAAERVLNNKSDDMLLYHFTESIAANSLRYRWMMCESSSSFTRHLSFTNSLIDSDRTCRSFMDSIPPKCKLIQLKYFSGGILLHLLEKKFVPSYIYLKNDHSLMIQLHNKIKEYQTLLRLKNSKPKKEKIEQDLGHLVEDFEKHYLGPFKFLLLGDIQDYTYQKFVDKVTKAIIDRLPKNLCRSNRLMSLLIHNSPTMSRAEFCSAFTPLATSAYAKECFDIWLGLFEKNFTKDQVNSFPRGQIGLILDKNFVDVPWENLPTVRLVKQGIFRIPSLRILHIIASRGNIKTKRVDVSSTFYILDPENNLPRTKNMFCSKLKSVPNWQGLIGSAPEANILKDWLITKQIYLFIGHGSGLKYYDKLMDGHGLTALDTLNPMAIVMGCSSAKIVCEATTLEPYGVSYMFLLKGCPSYVGLLWDVTDTDIDKFLDSLLDNWLLEKCDNSIAAAVALSRLVCQFKYLVGAAPVIYGLPVYLKHN